MTAEGFDFIVAVSVSLTVLAAKTTLSDRTGIIEFVVLPLLALCSLSS